MSAEDMLKTGQIELPPANFNPCPEGEGPVVDPLLRSEYRKRLKEAICLAGEFDGSSRSFEALMQVLIQYDEWLREAFEGEGRRLNEQQETTLYRRYNRQARGKYTIGDIMDFASRRLDKVLKGMEIRRSESRPAEVDLLTVDLNGVLLPPGDVPANGPGERVEWKEVRFLERLRQLVKLLVDNEIFTDDIVICRGKVDPTMMREVTYNLVEIPKLNKQILVCDQVGEATFIIDGILSREILMTLTKEALQEKFLEKVTRIVYRVKEQWEGDVIDALLGGKSVKDYAHVNVRDRESLRQYIQSKFTPEQWAGMNVIKRKKLKIYGFGLTALSRKFNVEGMPLDHIVPHLILGQRIYGEDHECLKVEEKREYTMEEIRADLLEKFPTAEQWAGMQVEDRRKMKVGGLGMRALARMFNVKGAPQDSNMSHKFLGQKIYGEDHECLKIEVQKALTLEEIKTEILRQVPTAEQWAGMRVEDRKKLKVFRLGIVALATRFGVKGDPTGNNVFHRLLGQKIYGEEHECLKVDENLKDADTSE